MCIVSANVENRVKSDKKSNQTKNHGRLHQNKMNSAIRHDEIVSNRFWNYRKMLKVRKRPKFGPGPRDPGGTYQKSVRSIFGRILKIMCMKFDGSTSNGVGREIFWNCRKMLKVRKRPKFGPGPRGPGGTSKICPINLWPISWRLCVWSLMALRQTV